MVKNRWVEAEEKALGLKNTLVHKAYWYDITLSEWKRSVFLRSINPYVN